MTQGVHAQRSAAEPDGGGGGPKQARNFPLGHVKSAPPLPRWEGRGDRSLRSAHRSRPHRLMMIKVNFASFTCLIKGPEHDIMSEKKLMETCAWGRRMVLEVY